MSIYNETLEEIKYSVYSILQQTFQDYEIIIVVDNPDNDKYRTFLNDLQTKDKRLKVIYNSKNIGLAMSMNKAASIAKGKYFARMDSDDISDHDRLRQEISVLETKKYDLVFSNYIYIDELSHKIQGDLVAQTVPDNEKELKYSIIFKALIHHPTVLMTREIFENCGGYRDFPCSQDLDLWLRMYLKGCRFYMIPESLLLYRLRKNSVSNLKRLQQHLTIIYIKRLFLQRILFHEDNYSKQAYEAFIKQNMRKNLNYSFDEARELLSNSKALQKTNHFKYYFYRTKVFIISKDYRNNYVQDKFIYIVLSIKKLI